MMIKIGIVGARGTSTMMGFNANADARVVALCDLDEERLAAMGERFGISKTFRVFEDMLAADIDAVVIGTPMQCHVPQAIAALEAGKHVLSEVTAGVTMDELWWLKEAVEHSGKTYMYAENYCYMPQNQLVRAMVRQGLFGEVYYGAGEYLHEIRELTKYPNGKDSWRRYWQLGKRGSFYPTHSLGPVMQWFEGDRVAQISCFSPGHHGNGDLRQDDTTDTQCQLASGKLVRIRVDCMSPRPHNMTGYQLQGTKGAFESARDHGGKNLVWFDALDDGSAGRTWHDLMDFTEYLPERYRNATKEQGAAGHGGGDFFLVEDFIQAIKTGTAPDIDVYQACEWTAVGLLSELSVMNKGRTMDVPDFRRAKDLKDQIIRL